MRVFAVDCYGRADMLIFHDPEINADDPKAAKKIANEHAREKGLQPVHFEATEVFDSSLIDRFD